MLLHINNDSDSGSLNRLSKCIDLCSDTTKLTVLLRRGGQTRRGQVHTPSMLSAKFAKFRHSVENLKHRRTVVLQQDYDQSRTSRHGGPVHIR